MQQLLCMFLCPKPAFLAETNLPWLWTHCPGPRPASVQTDVVLATSAFQAGSGCSPVQWSKQAPSSRRVHTCSQRHGLQLNPQPLPDCFRLILLCPAGDLAPCLVQLPLGLPLSRCTELACVQILEGDDL